MPEQGVGQSLLDLGEAEPPLAVVGVSAGVPSDSDARAEVHVDLSERATLR